MHDPNRPTDEEATEHTSRMIVYAVFALCALAAIGFVIWLIQEVVTSMVSAFQQIPPIMWWVVFACVIIVFGVWLKDKFFPKR